MMEEKATTIVCDECNHEFKLSVPEEQQININGNILTLVYFTCPKCNKIYKVCLQDARYYELKEDLEKAKKRIRRNRGRNNVEMHTMLSNLALAKQAKLQRHVEVLNSKYTGTFTFATSGNNSKDKTIIYLP